MTQHPPAPTDRQHPTQDRPQHPLDDTSAPSDQEAGRESSRWWIGLLALLPIACCGLPLLFAAGVSAGSGAVLGGITGGVLILVGAVALGIWEMRRRARSTRATDTSTAAKPPRDRCC